MIGDVLITPTILLPSTAMVTELYILGTLLRMEKFLLVKKTNGVRDPKKEGQIASSILDYINQELIAGSDIVVIVIHELHIVAYSNQHTRQLL